MTRKVETWAAKDSETIELTAAEEKAKLETDP
jgi:hypothetical protein